MAVVYVVEDQENVADALERILLERGHTPRTFRDGLEAYAQVFEHPPDLLVLDVLIPSLNGLALARLVKLNEDLQHVPVLVVSSLSDDVAEAAAAVGVDGLLPKPFDVAAFVREAERLLSPRATDRAG